MTKLWNMRLPHDETDERKRYAMPDPDVHLDAYIAARAQLAASSCTGLTPKLSAEQLARLVALAEGYVVLTTHEAGQTAMQEKLGDIWRARRARE